MAAGIAADRGGLDVGPIAGIGAGNIQVAPSVLTPAPGVNDLMAAFKNGFITVDDIQKRLADRPVDASNRALTLQANDFKSKQITQLGPAELALQAHRLALDEKKTEALEKDLNANEDTRPAREAYTLTKAQHEAALVSPDPKIRREAVNQQHFYDLERAYSAATSEPVPESFQIEGVARVDDFSTWLQKTLPDKVNKLEADFVAQYPQAVPADVLQFREDAKTETLKSAGSDYNAYKAAREKQKDVVQQGTPEYYKELQRRLTEGVGKQLTEKAQFDAYKAGLEATAKGTAVKPHPTTVKRINAAGQEEEVLVLTDPVTGAKTGETILSTTAPKLTAEQANAGLFATRMTAQNKTLTELERQGFDATTLGSTVQSFLPNRLRTEDFQIYKAARDNWISAALRKESGAAISAKEYTQAYKEYFPQDGDSKAVVLQKQALRALVEEQMHKIAGPSSNATAATAAPVNDYESLVGKTVTLKDGRTGTVIKNADGTYSLK